LGDGFWPDLTGALALLAGVALGGVVFDDFAGLRGAAVGVTVLLIVRAIHRLVTHRGTGGPRAEPGA
jgi:hypothetical protein